MAYGKSSSKAPKTSGNSPKNSSAGTVRCGIVVSGQTFDGGKATKPWTKNTSDMSRAKLDMGAPPSAGSGRGR